MDELTASWFTDQLSLPADRPQRAPRADLLSRPAESPDKGDQMQDLMRQAGAEGTLGDILPGAGV